MELADLNVNNLLSIRKKTVTLEFEGAFFFGPKPSERSVGISKLSGGVPNGSNGDFGWCPDSIR